MKIQRAVLLATFVLSASLCAAQGLQDTTKHGDVYKIIDAIQMMMQGGSYDQVKQYASSEGIVVTRDSVLHLLGVLKGKDRATVLREDSTRQGVQIIARSNKNEDALYVVLKTVNAAKGDPHFHSLVLYKEPETGWQIFMWHVGM
jgi:hypothetical protein